jgi:hypothetical protein
MVRLPPFDVLCAYLEPLVFSSARAVIVGDASAAPRLLEIGARSVHVFDPDETRAAMATPPRGVQVQVLPDHDFDVRDGAFQIGLIPDLAALPDTAATLARLRRVLGADGVLLACASNPDVTGEGIGYYDLYDKVALQFAAVRMIGVIEFSGTTLAELGGEDEQPDVSVDTQLIDEPAPPYAFCALASQSEEVRLAPYAIVQHAPLAEAPSAVFSPPLFSPPPLPLRESEISPPPASLAETISPDVDRIAVLEAALADTSERLDEALRKTEKTTELFSDLQKSLDDARAAKALAEERLKELDNSEELARLEAQLEVAEERLKELDNSEELARLEAQLEERGRTIADLEKEVRRREKIAKDLIMALEQKEVGEEVRDKIDALALELARRHSELEASKWRVAELERKLAATAPNDQVEVLRQALAQEHEARVHAESGQALEQARAELQKQAVLLEQARGPSR